jgi:Polymerase beta, Nucleotidyltransferase
MEPTTEPRTALRRLRENPSGLAELAMRFDLLLLVAFGSVLQPGDPHDLDLAVAAEGPLDALVFMEALYQLTGYERIDVLDLRRAGVVARVEALRDGQVLFERDEGEHNERLVQALALFWDTQWLRDLELEALAR